MYVTFANALTVASVSAFALAGAIGEARAAEPSTSVTSESALHTPQSCDVTLTLEDIAKIQAPKAAKRFKVAFNIVSLAGYWYQANAYGATKAAQEAGVDLTVDAAQGFSTQAQQITSINSELVRGIDGLMMNPVDVNGAVAAVEAVVAKGIPVVSNGTLVNSNKADKLVQDDYTQGIAAADFIASKLPGGGEGIVQGGPANATWALRRLAGFEDAIKKYPNIKISAITHENVDPAEGLSKFTNATQAHPQVDWIYSTYNLLLPPGSVPQKYNKAVYVAGGFDPVMIGALKAGTATAVLPDYPVSEGYLGMSYLVRKLNGEKLPPITCLPNGVATSDDVSSTLLRSQNLYPEGWKLPGH